jgi:hypothetical protein
MCSTAGRSASAARQIGLDDRLSPRPLAGLRAVCYTDPVMELASYTLGEKTKAPAVRADPDVGFGRATLTCSAQKRRATQVRRIGVAPSEASSKVIPPTTMKTVV